MTREPIFPIIQIFKGDDIIYGCAAQNEFIRCDISYVDKYKDSIVIDSTGVLFKIKKAEKIGWGTLLFGYSPLMKGRSVKVRFTYSEDRTCQWKEFKEIIAEKFRKKHDAMWYANNPKLILTRMNESQDFKKIIELFSYHED